MKEEKDKRMQEKENKIQEDRERYRQEKEKIKKMPKKQADLYAGLTYKLAHLKYLFVLFIGSISHSCVKVT